MVLGFKFFEFKLELFLVLKLNPGDQTARQSILVTLTPLALRNGLKLGIEIILNYLLTPNAHTSATKP